MAQLGHTSIQITFDRYGHLYEDVALDIAARLDGTFLKAQQQVDHGHHALSSSPDESSAIIRRLATADENY